MVVFSNIRLFPVLNDFLPWYNDKGLRTPPPYANEMRIHLKIRNFLDSRQNGLLLLLFFFSYNFRQV